MGSDSFFSKLASIDPLAQALNLPGAHRYAQSEAQRAAGQTDTNGGAYTGINASLAGANAGYAPGGPGSTVGFTPTQPTGGNRLMGGLQGLSNAMPGVPWSGHSYGASNVLGQLGGAVKTFNGAPPAYTPAPASSYTATNPFAAAAGNAAKNATTTSYGGP